jgi:hypothetical protein
MATADKWMPVFTVNRTPRVAHGAHPDVADPKRRSKAAESQDYWQRIGTAFANSKGGFTIRLTAFPLNGTLVVRPPEVHERIDPTMKG